ncbi:MAG: hypothetical protein IKR52_07750 [Paludibacteraceae bacterium]|nr:hypothetical protein [Paludibacteraceae bacterium]
MKKFLLLPLLWAGALLSAYAALNFPTPVAYVNFSNNTSQGASYVENSNPDDEPYTEAANIGGSACRKIPSGKFMYVKFDRNAVPSSQRQVMIKITYYGNNSNALWFNYNGTSNDYAGADFTKVNADGWVTTIVALTDANFRGTMNSGGDIRLGYSGSDNYIKDIALAFGTFDPDNEPIPTKRNLPSNQFKGRSFGGYQIWHEAGPNDSDWVHWTYGHKPGPGFHMYNGVDVSSFPDISEYDDNYMYATNFGNLGNGQPTKLYNSKDAYIINKQMQWMQTAGFDGVAVQRFVGGIGKSVTESDKSHLTNVKNACEATGRLFYICYDLNGSDATIVQRIKMDWVYEIEQIRALTSSNNYATVDGKPVVELWGIGYDMATPEQNNGIIDFLHSRGCYVIGGTPNGWSSGGAYATAYKKLDCVSPWTVGVYGGDIASARNYKNTMLNDKAYCDANGMDYLPVVFAGSANWLTDDLRLLQNFRRGGELLWAQITNAYEMGLNSVYFAMVDEFEESTNLIKGAVDYFDIPVDQYFETFSRDGIWVSSDFYLRLASYAAQVLRGEKTFTAGVPVPYSEGPVYFRNSFESKLSTINKNGSGKGQGQQPDYSIDLPVDPCFYNNSVLKNNNMSNANCAIVKNAQRRSGDYSVLFEGNANAGADYAYKTNETKIVVKDNMKVSYYKYASNENGKSAFVDLLFSDNTRLSDMNGSPVVTVSTQTGAMELVEFSLGTSCTGKTISGILMAYKGNAGNFSAYFDDVIIEDGEPAPVTGKPDMVVTDFFWTPANPKEGDHVTFYATVKNQGDAATPNNVKHGLSFHVTGVDGATWSDTHYASIPAGASVDLTINGGTPNAYWTCGPNATYTVMAWVNDNGGTFEESDMNNNQMTKTIYANGTVGIGDLPEDGTTSKVQKIIRNGRVIILKDGVEYNILGQKIVDD